MESSGLKVFLWKTTGTLSVLSRSTGRADLIGNCRFGLAYDIAFKNAAGLPATAADSQSQSKYQQYTSFEKGACESPVNIDFTLLGWNMESAVSQQRLTQGFYKLTRRKSRPGRLFLRMACRPKGYVNVSAQMFLAQFIA
jgi:hypothetical protein